MQKLARHAAPSSAGRRVWDEAEPWISAVRGLAPSAGVLVAELVDWVALLDRHSTVSVETTAAGVRVTWENVEGIGAHEAECAFREGALKGLIEASSADEPHVLHVRCREKGDEACVFRIDDVAPREHMWHARILRESSLLSASLAGRETIFRRMAAVSARRDPFPDVRDLRAVRRFMEELEDPVLVFDRGLELLDANHAMIGISGLSIDELRGQSLRDLVSNDSFRRIRAALPALFESGSLRGMVIDARTRSGSAKLEISARMSANGQILVCVARDVGERLRLESELAERNRQLEEQNERISQADRLKSEFLANVSHELTTPITCIKGFAKLLVGDIAGEERGEPARIPGEKRIEFLHIMEREAERMTDLIRGLLELSRIESGVVTLDRARVSLNGIVRETVLVLKPRIDERSLTLELELDPALPQVWLDPDRMKQVVLNLVENAIKFTDPASAIRIRTGRVGEKLRIAVRNSAPELSNGDLSRVFDRFVQRDGTFSRAHGGVGLGLNLVRAIVELHGGRVWGELPEPGQVEFTAEVPLVAG